MTQEVRFEQSSCPLCGGTAAEALHEQLLDVRYNGPGQFAIVECQECGLARLSPRPDRASIGAFYDSRYAPYQDRAGRHGTIAGAIRAVLSWPYKARYGSTAQAWEPPAPGAVLLDIGCSSGEFLARMRAQGWDVWGIELDRDAAARAAERTPSADRIFVGSALEADYPTASFEAITASHLLEHLHDPAELLTRAHRWLRPGGSVHIWVPNISSLESRLFGRHWSGLDVPRHLHHFNARTLTSLLEKSGFHEISVRPQFQGSSFASSLTALAASLTGREAAPGAGALYRMAAPIGWLLSGLGNRAYLQVSARRA